MLRQLDPGRLLALSLNRDVQAGVLHHQPRALVAAPATGDTLVLIKGPSIAQALVRDLTGPDGRTIGGRQTPFYFGGRPQIAFSPVTGIVIAHGTDPIIDYWHLDGRHRLRVRIEVELPSLDATFQRDYFRRTADLAAARGQGPEAVQRLRERMVFADHVGFSGEGFVDDLGYLWLYDLRRVPWAEPDDAISYHLIDPDGRYLGTTELPGICGVYSVVGGRLLGATYDRDTGVSEVVVMRIQSAVEGWAYPSR